jgi:PD-(D/E)XK endonuclease
MHKYELGNTSEGIVLSAYLSEGFNVSIPFGTGASYDLVVDSGFRLYKIQVKTGWLRGGCAQYKSQRRQPGASLTRRPYKNSEVDYFVVNCPGNGTIYAVPAENHGGQGRLRLEPARNGQSKLVRWAEDYTWERHVKELRDECARQDLNLRPPAPEAGALSAELRARKKDSRTGQHLAQNDKRAG